MSDATLSIGYNLDQLKADAVKAEAITREMGKKAKESMGGGGGSGAGAVALGAAGVAAGAIWSGFREVVAAYDEIGDTALKLNESTTVVQKVGAAAKLSGSSVEGLSSAFLKLEKNLGEVGNEKGSQALAHFGVTAEGLMSLPLDEKILLLSDAFAEARETGVGYNDLLVLMGKSAGELIPLLAAGKDEIKGMFDSAKVLSDEKVQRLAALNDQFDAGAMRTKAFTAEVAAANVGLFDFFKTIAKTGSVDKAFASVGEFNQKSQMDAAARERSRVAGAKAIQDTQMAAANELKLTKEKSEQVEQLKVIEQLNQKINILALGELNSVDKLAELEKQRTKLFAQKNKSGGLFFDDSKNGLQKWADSLHKDSKFTEELNVLSLLEKELGVEKEISAVTQKMREAGASAAEEEYEKKKASAKLLQEEYQTNADLMKRFEDERRAKEKEKRGKEEGTRNELDQLRIEELRNSSRNGAANKLERERNRRINEEKLRDNNPDMSPDEVRARAQRMQNIEDRKAGIIGRTTNYIAPESDWGLDHRGASALDAFGMKGRLDLAAKMGPSRLGHRGPLGHTAMATDAAAHKASENTSLVTIQNSALQELKSMRELLAA